MKLRRVHILLPILILILTGCFRQASQPLETQLTSNTAIPTDPVPFDDPADTTGDDANGGEPTPTLLITMIMSTPIVPATPAVDDPDAVDDQTDTVQTGPVPLVSPTLTATRQIITPGAPSGPSAITTPTPFDASAAEPTPSGLVTPTSVFGEGSEECIYVVQPGDNLFRISVNNNTTVDALRASNPQLRSDLIQPGDRINLPDCVGGSTGVVVPPVEEPPITAPIGGGTTHTVQAGETLFVIAQRYSVTVDSIVQANSLTNPDRLSVGQQLIIPGN